MTGKQHWEQVYTSKSSHAVSWYQAQAQPSLDLIRAAGIGPGAAVIDIGAGASTLVEGLLDAGFGDITLLDISAAALNVTRQRLGPRADQVHWIEADIRTVALAPQAYDVWHDRAVFHFLVEQADRDAYVRQATAALRPGATLIIGTFASDGPERCSGLPIVRYDPEALAAPFDGGFELQQSLRHLHRTPMGTTQAFTFCRFRRLAT